MKKLLFLLVFFLLPSEVFAQELEQTLGTTFCARNEMLVYKPASGNWKCGKVPKDCTLNGTILTCGTTVTDVRGPQGEAGPEGTPGKDATSYSIIDGNSEVIGSLLSMWIEETQADLKWTAVLNVDDGGENKEILIGLDQFTQIQPLGGTIGYTTADCTGTPYAFTGNYFAWDNNQYPIKKTNSQPFPYGAFEVYKHKNGAVIQNIMLNSALFHNGSCGPFPLQTDVIELEILIPDLFTLYPVPWGIVKN